MFSPTPFSRVSFPRQAVGNVTLLSISYILYMKKLFSSHAVCSQTGLAILRIALGVLFLSAGIMKLMDMPMVVGYFASMGLSAAIAWIVSIAEVIAGAALVLGIFTRIASLVIIVIMVVASIIMAKTTGFLSAEPTIFYAIAGLVVLLSGSGMCSLASKMCKGGCSGCTCSAGACDCKDETCCK